MSVTQNDIYFYFAVMFVMYISRIQRCVLCCLYQAKRPCSASDIKIYRIIYSLRPALRSRHHQQFSIKGAFHIHLAYFKCEYLENQYRAKKKKKGG